MRVKLQKVYWVNIAFNINYIEQLKILQITITLYFNILMLFS